MLDTQIRKWLNRLHKIKTNLSDASFRKILFLCPSSAVGDTVVETFFTRALRNSYPNAEITLVIRPPYHTLIDTNIVDKFILLPHNTLLKLLFLLFKIPYFRKQRYDLIIDLPYSSYAPWRYLFLFLLKGKTYLASNVKGYDFITYSFSWQESPRHIAEEVYGQALSALGITPKAISYHIPISNKAAQQVQALLQEMGIVPQDRLLLLNPEGSLWMRKLTPQKAITLAQRLTKELPNWKIIILQYNQQYETPASNVYILRIQQLDLLAVLMKRINYMVSVDTGTVHLADSFAKPMCILFSSTAKEGYLRPYVEKFWGSINPLNVYLKTQGSVNDLQISDIVKLVVNHLQQLKETIHVD